MPRKCYVCNKSRLIGNNVSHSNNRTSKISLPNLQRVRIMENGRKLSVNVCTRCLRSGLVQKAV